MIESEVGRGSQQECTRIANGRALARLKRANEGLLENVFDLMAADYAAHCPGQGAAARKICRSDTAFVAHRIQDP
jgi:hypothetical protein